jgi:hypothetical protein
VYVAHPALPLAMSIAVSPLAQSAARVEELEVLSEDYALEPLDGIDSDVVGWMDESAVPELPHRG